ncbi:MAG: hypothetical protein KF773_23365 [Deltaproteobacteria bacterium]|nr:hypothetical protein [Deltaproteobacteria bacterium]
MPGRRSRSCTREYRLPRRSARPSSSTISSIVTAASPSGTPAAVAITITTDSSNALDLHAEGVAAGREHGEHERIIVRDERIDASGPREPAARVREHGRRRRSGDEAGRGADGDVRERRSTRIDDAPLHHAVRDRRRPHVPRGAVAHAHPRGRAPRSGTAAQHHDDDEQFEPTHRVLADTGRRKIVSRPFSAGRAHLQAHHSGIWSTPAPSVTGAPP